MGANNQLYERSPEIYKATVTGGQPWLLPEDYSPDAEKMHEDYLRINDKAVSLSESAAKDIAQAKEGLSALEQAGVDISVNLIQMGMDAAGRAVGLGMLPFFMLTAGGAMLEAEQEGADSWGQLGYGLTKATIEVGTEKLFDGLAGVFGKGAADDVIEGLIGKLTGSNTGRTLLRAFAGAAGEGTEEVISDLLDPFAKLIYNDQALKEAWENRADLRDQMLYDFLIGAAMGGFGSVVSIATGQNAEKNAKLGEADARKQANPAPQPPAEQKNTALSQAESTTVNTDPAQHTAAEQAVIDEYHAAVDDKLVKYIETVRANKGAKIERYSLKPVAERAAKDIMQLTGVDASGNQTAIEARIIEHILKRHGENGTANHSMRDINDIARIQYVLDNYDTAAYGGKSQAYQTVKPNGRPGQADTVIFSKAVNGTYYVIEAVPVTKKKTVFITSAYMSKQKAGDVQTADADAWRVTSETKNAQTPAVEDKASINSISQSGGKYNSNDQSAEVTGSVGERAAKGSPLGGAVSRRLTEGGNSAAKPTTDPAEAAVEQEYRRLVENAITEGDYQRAVALYREYNNPALRAYKEFYTLKTFSEYAASQGYGVSPALAEEISRSHPVKNMSQDAETNNTAERITEDESVRNFRKDIKEGKVSLRISPQKQARHILGSKEHNAYRERLANRGDFPAYIREDLSLAALSEIVKEKAGNGSIGQKTDRSFKEYVDCDEIIGYYYCKEEGKYVPTYRAMIIYSLGDKNIHIVPVKKLYEVKK